MNRDPCNVWVLNQIRAAIGMHPQVPWEDWHVAVLHLDYKSYIVSL